jgi:Ca-activated chloride channel family protein
MQWARPQLAIVLLAVPVAAVVVVAGWRAGRRWMAQFAHPTLLPELAGSVDWRARRVRLGLVLAALAALAVAAMGPQWGLRWEQTQRRGLDIVIALDVSKSMLAQDLKPSRLARAKLAVLDLLPMLQGDRVALVAFAGTSFLQCPLTTDYDAFATTLEELGPDEIPRGGTAVGQAIRTALGAFERSSQGARVMVLLTDGEDHEGTSAAAAKEAADQGVQIFAVGLGTPEGELIPEAGPAGDSAFLKDRQGRTIKSRLDEATLQQLAAATGGAYVRATPTSFGLVALYRQRIAGLERGPVQAGRQQRHEDRFQWPLAAAWLLLLAEPLLSDRKPSTPVAT